MAVRVRGGTAALLPGLPTALRLLPRPQTRALDLGTLFSGARLSRYRLQYTVQYITVQYIEQ